MLDRGPKRRAAERAHIPMDPKDIEGHRRELCKLATFAPGCEALRRMGASEQDE